MAGNRSHARIAVIGGSGFYAFPDLEQAKARRVRTPYADVHGLVVGMLNGIEVVFLARHGDGHRLPPHKVNYRANIWALRELGVSKVIALNAVGGISKNMCPRAYVVPDQIIDYTYGREHTFADLVSEEINHVDFTEPFSSGLREAILTAAGEEGIPCVPHGVYGCTQGPRLETAAEIRRLANDGCDIVGMTAMPEAGLARELGLHYASISLVVNWGAGISADKILLDEIHAILGESNADLRKWLVRCLTYV